LLWFLLALFVGRVLGQFAVALDLAPFLPPMQSWYSGLLSYKPLLASQVVIIVVFTRVCLDLSRGAGFFARPRWALAGPLWVFGWVYAAAMVTRYVITMALLPERRWIGGTIPIVFHFVLAAFLLVLADHHRRALAPNRVDH
jgi:hypothetical protein